LGKDNRAYKSAKRTRELLRLKKREEKRLRHLARNKMPREEEKPTTGEETPEPHIPESE
jgi:hypothetical protein